MTGFLKRWNINVRSAYFKILASTITVAVIPILLLYVFAYFQAASMIERQTGALDAQFLSKTRENTEQALLSMQTDATSLANSRDSIQFVFSRQVSDWTIILRLGQDLASLADYDSLIDSAYIYSANNGKLVTSDHRYYSADEFYDQSWLPYYERGTDPVYWLAPRTIVGQDGSPYTGISLIAHVPSQSRKLSGAVVLNFSAEKIGTQLLSSNIDSSASQPVAVLGPEGSMLFGSAESEALLQTLGADWLTPGGFGSRTVRTEQGTRLLTYTYSPELSWYFIRASELGPALWGDIDVWPLLVFLCVFIALACFLAVRMSRRLYQPIQTLVENITGQSFSRNSASDEYGTIHTEYSRMQAKASELESEITALQPLVKERFFLRLLRGQADQPQKELSQFGFGPSDYAVFIVRYVSSKAATAGNNDLRYFQARARLEDILRGNPAFRFACVEIGGDTIAAVLNFKEPPASVEARGFLLHLSKFSRETLARELQIDIVTGFSPLCQTAAELPLAYTAALKSVRFKLFQDSDDMILENDELFSPYTALLQDLLEQIAAGEENYAKAALEELFSSIRKNLERLSQFQIQQIATWMLNSVMEVLIQNKLKSEQVFGAKRNLFAELQKNDDLDSIYKWMESICVRATEELAQANVRQTNQKVLHMRDYIEQHLSEDISLNDISALVGLSPAYVSRMFKENTGQNFVEYLSICRVEQAKALLQNTKLSIKEIGFKSGFNSMQTFIRTFKKLAGCTPSQYRGKA